MSTKLSIKSDKLGILLVNLGTPDEPKYWSVRRYLREFLSDPRVLEINPILKWLLLNVIVLNIRPFIAAKNYASIWDNENKASPLAVITKNQAQKIQELMQEEFFNREIPLVRWAMRYGSYPIGDVMQEMMDAGCKRILVFPLYPQYSATTTASVIDAVNHKLSKTRYLPNIRYVFSYYHEECYVNALANSINKKLKNFEPNKIVVSFHGLPVRYVNNGDPYRSHCIKTVELLKAKLPNFSKDIVLSFQSRFGREEWLQPYLSEKVEQLAKEGHKKILVISPGFAADCIETLEELEEETKEIFIKAGGEEFVYVPCLNSSEEGINMLMSLIKKELTGWF